MCLRINLWEGNAIISVREREREREKKEETFQKFHEKKKMK